MSCAQHTLDDTLKAIKSSKDSFVAVHGKLTFDPAQMPATNANGPEDTPPLHKVPARLNGKSLTRAGFSADFNQAITLNVGCIGPWCASAPSGKMTLAFVKKTSSGYSIALSPCGGNLFISPPKSALRRTLQCAFRENCP